MPKRFLTLFAGILFLAGCGTPDPFEPISTGGTYLCSYGKQMVISVGDRSETAAIAFEGRNLTLIRTRNDGDGAAFSNAIYALYLDEDRGAVLEREDIPYYSNCFPE